MYKCPICNFSTEDIVAYSKHIADEADKKVKAEKDKEQKVKERAEKEIKDGIVAINAKIKAYNEKYGKTDCISSLVFSKEGRITFRGTRNPFTIAPDPFDNISDEEFKALLKSAFDITD